MDNETLIQLTQCCCPLLFNKNLGVASADTFLVENDLEKSFQQSRTNNFFYQIVNTSKSDQIGQHWILVCLVAVGRGFGHRKTKNSGAKTLFENMDEILCQYLGLGPIGVSAVAPHLDSQTLEPGLEKSCQC